MQQESSRARMTAKLSRFAVPLCQVRLGSHGHLSLSPPVRGQRDAVLNPFSRRFQPLPKNPKHTHTKKRAKNTKIFAGVGPFCR
jgi:hypothetical protein